MHTLELLAPGGSPEGLKACVNAGADAIYMGGQRFGARAFAQNPDEKGLLEALEYCHIHGRKLYLTVNTLLREDELEMQLYDSLAELYENGLDAVLVQDLGVLSFIKEEFPGMEIHASTQMSVSSVEGAQMMYDLGCSRVVPARELSLSEIRSITEQVPVQIECFVHGALCYCYSGQCLMSSLIGGRSGNRGRCAQPCRQCYSLREGENAIRGREGNYLLSLKDICTLDIIPNMIAAGICSFKIEGRMKRPEYAAGVTHIYRKYLDRYLNENQQGDRAKWKSDPQDKAFLMDLYNRGGFSEGYYSGDKGSFMMTMGRPNHAGTEAAVVLCDQDRNRGRSQTGYAAEEKTGIRRKRNPGFVQEAEDWRNKGNRKNKENGIETGRSIENRTGRKNSRARALEDLFAGDVLEIEDRGGENSRSITLKENIRKGSCFSLQEVQGLRPEQVLRRTRSEHQLRQIQTEYMSGEITEKINGNFTMHAGEGIILEVSAETASPSARLSEGTKTLRTRAFVTGPVPQKAVSSALTQDQLRKQLSRTGGTPFTFACLQIDCEDGLFLPVTALNELRRQALDGLRRNILSQYTENRIPVSLSAGTFPKQSVNAPKQQKEKKRSAGSRVLLSASVETVQQLLIVSEIPGVDIVCPDSCLYLDMERNAKGRGREKFLADTDLLHRQGKKCFLMYPQVWRKDSIQIFDACFDRDTLECADGFLLRNQQQLSSSRIQSWTKGKEIITDSMIYSWNRRSEQLLRQLGADRITLPDELNEHQLLRRGCEGTEMVIWGRQILMNSAQCLWKNTDGCTGRPAIRILRDRMRAEFPVKNKCSICTNVIYNSVPLDLLDSISEIRDLGCSCVRLNFTVETASETEKAARAAVSVLHSDQPAQLKDGTRGHFRRGVE